jgi:hypothetical protein
MPKICVASPEIVMSGDINITAQFAIVTKAKLDAISVNGSCSCDDLPPPPPRPVTPPKASPDLDLVFLVDGSDSFDGNYHERRTTTGGHKENHTQFSDSMGWVADMLKNDIGPNWGGKATATVVQFSGIKALEESYEPDNDGDAFGDRSGELKHYNVEYGPAAITPSASSYSLENQLRAVESLGGNSQLYLVMQDMSSPRFLVKLSQAMPTKQDVDRIRIMVIVTDEEWDIRNLRSSESLNKSISDEADLEEDVRRVSTAVQGSGRLDRQSRVLVPKMASDRYNEIFAVIVRPNSGNDLNEKFIVDDICKGKNANYKKVYANNFVSGMETARKEIAKAINAIQK